MSTEPEKRSDEERLSAMCEAEFGWEIDEFIALARRLYPSLLAALAASRADNERLSFLVRAAEVDVQLRADFEVAGDRLIAARNALLLDGYFTEDEVGEDVAPRIVERLAAARVEVSQLRAKVEKMRNALTYISSPTMGLPANADAAEYAMSGATEDAARYALSLCIGQARAALAEPLGSTPVQGAATETMVEIGGVTMTEAQFDAARFPLLAGDPGPTGVSDEATWVAADAPWPTPDQPATEENQ